MKFKTVRFIPYLMMVFIHPANSMEISADKVRTIQQYNGSSRVVFKTDEKFSISGDNASQENGVTVFSGNVNIKCGGTTLSTDVVTLKQQADGSSLLESPGFILEKIEGRNEGKNN